MSGHDTAGRAALTAWLAAMWLLLWGTFSWANLVNGLLIGALLSWLVPPASLGEDQVVIRPIAALSFGLWFAKALVLSNLAVAKEVLAPADRSGIRPAIVACPLRTRSGRLATVIANAITLTPGTMTVDARGRPAVLFVHVMSFEDRASVLADVDDLERRVVEAFGTVAERRVVLGASDGDAEEVVP